MIYTESSSKIALNGKGRRIIKKLLDSKQELSLLNSFHERYLILLSSVFLENSFHPIIQHYDLY